MSNKPMALVRMDADPAGLAAHWADHIGMVVLKNPGYTFSAHFTADQAREVGRQLIAAADAGKPEPLAGAAHLDYAEDRARAARDLPERCPHGYHVTEGYCSTCDADQAGAYRADPEFQGYGS